MSQRKFIVALLALLALRSSHAIAQMQLADAARPALFSSSSSSSSSRSADVAQAIPNRVVVREQLPVRPFSQVAVALQVNTLGTGFEIATPLARAFNLRAGFDIFAFGYPFDIDHVHYDAGLHLQSEHLSVDWFPWHNGFHISPGVYYMKNAMSAPSSVPPGQYFELGDQGFTNSVTDPVKGTADAVFPHRFAPALTMGFGNILPRSGRHFSVPFEFGAAYTGAPQVTMTLNGTACTSDGCFTFADNQEALDSLKDEIHKINEDLKRVPVYPILSIGVGYRF